MKMSFQIKKPSHEGGICKAEGVNHYRPFHLGVKSQNSTAFGNGYGWLKSKPLYFPQIAQIGAEK